MDYLENCLVGKMLNPLKIKQFQESFIVQGFNLVKSCTWETIWFYYQARKIIISIS